MRPVSLHQEDLGSTWDGLNDESHGLGRFVLDRGGFHKAIHEEPHHAEGDIESGTLHLIANPTASL